MPASAPVFRFGIHRLDPAARELHRAGKLVQLSPMMFDCLVWLFERRERAVGRDELSAAVWGRVDITDAQIDQLIRKVRRAVGDTGSEQEIIRTIPRFGYRWVAEVQAEIPPAPILAEVPAETPRIEAIAPALPEPVAIVAETKAAETIAIDAPPRRSPRWRHLALAGGLSVLAIAAALALVVHLRGRDARTTPAVADPAAVEPPRRIENVAVLPVTIDAEVDSEWAWLRLGLMDLIAARLREGGLTVVPANNIIALTRDGESAPLDPAAVQAATGARIIVSPSVRKTSGGWRLHLELQGAESVAHEVETHADDAAASARVAADRLLVLLGKPPVVGEDVAARTGTQIPLYRIDAAIDGGDYEAARQLLDAAPPGLRDDGPFRLRRAQIERVAGHNAAARDLFQAVLDSHARTPLDPGIRTEALIGVGVILAEGSQMAAAKLRLDEAIELARHAHLPLLYGDAMASRAAILAAEGRDAEADSDFAQARIALELAGDTLGLAELEANQAGTLTARYHFAEARALLDRAITRMQRFPPGETLVTALGNKIFLHLAMLESRDALAVAEHSRETVERVENRWKRQAFLLHVARALLANGRFSQTRQLLDELGGSVDPQPSPHLQASVLGNLAQLAFANARWNDAANLAARQLEILSTPALSVPLYARTHSVAWLIRTRALQREGAIAAAAAEVRRFSAWAGSQHDAAVAVQVRLAQAEQAAVEHQPQAAIAAFEMALAAASRDAAPADVARVAVSYGGYLIEIADLEAATRIVGQTARWSAQDFECALLQVRLYHALGQPKAWQEALASARSLAGERVIPDALAVSPLGAQPPAGGFGVSSSSGGSPRN